MMEAVIFREFIVGASIATSVSIIGLLELRNRKSVEAEERRAEDEEGETRFDKNDEDDEERVLEDISLFGCEGETTNAVVLPQLIKRKAKK